MNTSYTPEPWHVEPEEWTEGRGIAICAAGGIVAIIDPEGEATAEDKANAQLIAASPTLFKGLETVTGALSIALEIIELHAPDHARGITFQQHIHHAQTAIKAATQIGATG